MLKNPSLPNIVRFGTLDLSGAPHAPPPPPPPKKRKVVGFEDFGFEWSRMPPAPWKMKDCVVSGLQTQVGVIIAV